jgi:hypothetical protein
MLGHWWAVLFVAFARVAYFTTRDFISLIIYSCVCVRGSARQPVARGTVQACGIRPGSGVRTGVRARHALRLTATAGGRAAAAAAIHTDIYGGPFNCCDFALSFLGPHPRGA